MELREPMDYTRRDSEIIQHYAQFWGQPSTVVKFDHEIQLAPAPIFALEFAPSSEDETWVYATVGASRRAMLYPDNWSDEKPERRIELFSCVRECNHALLEVLSSLALYPFQQKTFLAPGHTIPGAHSFVIDSPLTDVLFLPPYGMKQDFEVIRHHNGDHTHMLWTVPIYTSERLFIRQYGWKALVDLFFEHEPDISNLWRPPVA
jgi:hypothetical protein